MAQKHRLPLPGRWGSHPISYAVQLLANLTANATTTLLLGGTAVRSWISRVALCVAVVPVDSDGTLTATLKKWDASAAQFVTLSAPLDCETLTANVAAQFALLQTVSDNDRTLDVGDTLSIDFTNNSGAINTQPGQLVVLPELLVLT